MGTFKDLDYKKQNEVAQWFATWLIKYTDEVIDSVMARKDEIINNPFALNLLEELHKRTLEERKGFGRDIQFTLEHGDTMHYHNHPLEHAGSYRDVLYDMYIRDREKEDTNND